MEKRLSLPFRISGFDGTIWNYLLQQNVQIIFCNFLTSADFFPDILFGTLNILSQISAFLDSTIFSMSD